MQSCYKILMPENIKRRPELLVLCSRDSVAQDETGRLKHPLPQSPMLLNWSKSTQNPPCNENRKTKQQVRAEILPREFHYIGRLSLLGLFKEPGFRQRTRQTSPQPSIGPKKLVRALDRSLEQGQWGTTTLFVGPARDSQEEGGSGRSKE